MIFGWTCRVWSWYLSALSIIREKKSEFYLLSEVCLFISWRHFFIRRLYISPRRQYSWHHKSGTNARFSGPSVFGSLCLWQSSTVYFSHGYNRSLLLKEQFKELLRRSKITLKLKVMKVRKKSRSGRRKAEGFVYSSTSKWTHQMSPSWGRVYSVWPAVMRNPKHM